MVLTKVGQKYTLSIPAPFRSLLPVGQEVAISADAQGRLIIAPVEQVRTLLMETFGMWTDRTDLPTDSVEYVNEIRRGRRLDEMGAQSDDADHPTNLYTSAIFLTTSLISRTISGPPTTRQVGP